MNTIARRIWILAAVLAAASLGTSAWAPSARAQSAGVEVAGQWQTTYHYAEDSTADTAVTLSQSGATVSGTYQSRTSAGAITGRLYGRVLRGRWIEGDLTGSVRFVFSEDGRSFTGTWGVQDASSGGRWDGERQD